jgi:hypothetical protein
MKKIDEKCSAVGHLVAIEWGESPDKHTPYAQMTFRVDDGDHVSAIVRGKKHVTENTVEQVEEAFLAMGWDGEKDFRELDAKALSNRVILDIVIEEFESAGRDGEVRAMSVAVVNFIKPLNGKVTNKLSPDGVSAVFDAFQTFRARAAAKNAGGNGRSTRLPPSRPQDDFGDFPSEAP